MSVIGCSPAMLPLLLAGLLPAAAHAGTVALSASDFSLGLYQYTEAGTWAALDTGNLAGVFGPHRCHCPAKLSPALQLTSSGQTSIGSSTIGVAVYLGDNCVAAPASCILIGQASFSASQAASAPTFSSNAVFQAATGSASPDCTSLSADSTTLWAILTQDGNPLSFALTIGLPVSGATVGAPTGVTAQPANEGLLVSWNPPADATLVAGYQVLCLPRPTTASAAGYESCGLASNPDASVITPADVTQLCSAAMPASTRSVRLTGLTNGTPYTVAVVAIDPSGGTGVPSASAVATPQPTVSFWDKYEQAGGAATGCSLGRLGTSDAEPPVVAIAVLFLLTVRRRRRECVGAARPVALLAVLLLSPAARAEEAFLRQPPVEESSLMQGNDSPFAKPARSPGAAPDWGVQLGVSLYRPDVDSEFKNGAHPFADTFSKSRHLLSAAELDRYLFRRHGTWGVGLRVGYYRATAAAFLADGVTRSGDETALRLIPVSVSMLYLADQLPGLRAVPLIPYAKLGLDGTVWTASSTGASNSHTGVSLGWHATAGLMLGLGWLASSPATPGGIADPCALFFEWTYAAIDGLGLSHALHVGDSTWSAGIAFDL